MSLNQQSPPEATGQSIGCDPKSSKRNSGLFAFLKWFRPSTSRESIDADIHISRSSSCDSLNSTHSAGTVASFSYVPPSAYQKCVSEKCIALGPETDTYKARLKQRDKRRENDKNLTLRKKYNLFFNKETLLKPKALEVDEENSKSLPLMTRTTMEIEEDIKVHRRTNSESSKIKRAGAYLHVKGKRKAPQPPGYKIYDASSTSSLRRKKRLAPAPPAITSDKVINTLNQVDKSEAIVRADADIICNDSLKLDHGILKSAKDADVLKPPPDQNNLTVANSPTTSARSSYVETPVSPRPWYKRNSRDSAVITKKEKTDHKYEPIERLPEVSFMRNSTLDLTLEDAKPEKKKDEKRKSGLLFLTNISELDREASEIIKNKEHEKNGFGDIQEMPEFMRPKDTKINTDSWVSPKRRSARDLIAKFNAITNVTKVTVNSAFFGASQRDAKLFGKQSSLDETKRRQEMLLESHKKRIEEIDKKNSPLMKSESASAIKPKPDTPKLEKKSWKCPKCNLENEYWRIICYVCSAIKPYFDDFSTPTKTETKGEAKASSPLVLKKDKSPPKKLEVSFERSKTQIGFSALANYNANNKVKMEKNPSAEEKPQKDTNKKEEREKLKKMLIEMKNSLPKRKSNIMLKQNSRASVIIENPENVEHSIKSNEAGAEKSVEVVPVPEKTQEEKVAEILIGTTQTIYENIKVKKTENPKPVKVSSSAQTTSVVKQVVLPMTIANLVKEEAKKIEPPAAVRKANSEVTDVLGEPKNNNYELMRPKDFEDIYADTNGKSAARIYANLARNDELSLFFNMPKNFNNIKNNVQAKGTNNTDTIEINRLLRRLETSIAKGELTEAAIFAKELAQLKVHCSVIRQKPSQTKGGEKKKGIQIEMYVEDKISHRGPFPIEVTPDQTVKELKKQIQKEFEIPVDFQRWILGKELVTNENSTLRDHNITTEGCPVFLYLVAPDPKPRVDPIKATKNDDKNSASTSKSSNLPTENKLSKVDDVVPKTSIENKIERVRINVQNLQNKLNGSKNETNQPASTTDHAPKIVSVIPKVTETKQKGEARVIPIQIEKPDKEFADIPISVTEIKIEQKPASSAPSKEATEKTEYVLPVVPSSSQNIVIKPLAQKKIAKTVPSELDVKSAPPEQKDPPKSKKGFEDYDTKYALPAAPASSQNTAVQKTVIKTTATDLDVKVEPPAQKDPPKAKEEDFDDYDSNTLKPAKKEWECHLCTLLNPVSSNICAVCATVRLNKTNTHLPKKSSKKKAPQPSVEKEETYLQLVNLDNADLVENVEPFECVVCFLEIPPREGVTLRECLHQFCKTCLAHTIEFTEEAEVKCPYRDDIYSCNIALQDREIKALVTANVYEQYLAKSVAQAENKMDKSFHCKTPDCNGWCIFEDNVNEFRCPVCRKTNCLTCQAIHSGMNCRQYQEKMNEKSETDEDARRTKVMLEEMVNKGEAIECPTCKVILMKKWGCDWLRCSMCKTEICWVTRGPRWGPAGKGDTSGGCQCGVNGIKCHPKCNYCH